MTEAARWYNAVVRYCGLSAASFQLTSGNIPLGTTSTALWSIFDMVPPDAFENYNPAPGNSFSTNYGAILTALKPGGLASAALASWNNAGGFDAVKAYDRTVTDLRNGLNGVPGATVSFVVGKDSADLSGAWAQQGSETEGGLFRRSSQGSTRRVVPPPLQPGTVVEVRFDHVLTFVAGPLSKKNPLDVELRNYKPWYNSAALKLALDDRRAWCDPSHWPTYFKAGTGSLLRCITSIVVVDGVTSITRPAAASKTLEVELPTPGIKPNDPATDDVGFWPFAISPDERNEPRLELAALPSGGVTIVSKPGNPLLLGVNVQSISASLGATVMISP
ncbi:MAG: hypothetical protein L0H73_05870 [Nitrococcus sp.]|nr:hypothetical protein [Nitrococcus sp.]